MCLQEICKKFQIDSFQGDGNIQQKSYPALDSAVFVFTNKHAQLGHPAELVFTAPRGLHVNTRSHKFNRR
jgi:hypothetical protein